MTNNPKVIIIGAGAAGYAAACRLLENGFTNIQVLEAENRIGGRIHTVDWVDKGKIDLGAQWCHGEKDNIVYDMVKNLNLLEASASNYTSFCLVSSKGKFIDQDISDMLFSIFFQIEEEEKSNFTGSLGDYYIKRFHEKTAERGIDNDTLKQVQDLCEKFTNSLNASPSWFDVSAAGSDHYVQCEGDMTLNWKDKGYRTIFSVLKKDIQDSTEALPIDEKIIFNKEVNKVSWGKKGKSKSGSVRVDCNDGSSYSGDHVILTTSLGVLKENYKSLFDPELPVYKQVAIEGLSIGVTNKIFLKFPTKWWSDNCKGFSLLWAEDDSQRLVSEFPEGPQKDGKSWLEGIFGFYPVDYNPNVLLGWMTGELVSQYEKLTDEIVQKGCMFLLNKFLGSRYNIPQPEAMLRSKWYSNPHFRGSYSYRSMETERRNTSAADLARPLLSEGRHVLLFAGEATHSSFYSTVHGAIETGFREADRILQLYKSGLPKSKL